MLAKLRRFCRSNPVILASLFFALSGCGAPRQRVANATAPRRTTPGVLAQRPKLLLFGGEGHKTYLGCLNCSQYSADSVTNTYGTHGSVYSNESIWNHFNEFGSQFTNFGVCNLYATDPPVIVDGDGKFYGRLTMNQYHPERGIGANFSEWLADKVCK
jgi:hypothetical protein